MLLVLILWLLVYASTYSIVSRGTVVLVALGYEPPVAGLIITTGAFGLLVGGVLAYTLAERLERQDLVVDCRMRRHCDTIRQKGEQP